ncbi:predicted protein [Plenodomus lingam JN3]|uniref:Predicted protein n=1 Tax=Leptosphaeria maculans (strain JN3 / isolate v23.1.3 / race Av1-4-5-6-7-8) TaxID=985895 RepID=E4ZSW2_LEPMJ|nr:predicted protein [Plenodomus lingam JN3]CBX94550.1 predicted protein [Plenodomus lingam JN3]
MWWYYSSQQLALFVNEAEEFKTRGNDVTVCLRESGVAKSASKEGPEHRATEQESGSMVQPGVRLRAASEASHGKQTTSRSSCKCRWQGFSGYSLLRPFVTVACVARPLASWSGYRVKGTGNGYGGAVGGGGIALATDRKLGEDGPWCSALFTMGAAKHACADGYRREWWDQTGNPHARVMAWGFRWCVCKIPHCGALREGMAWSEGRGERWREAEKGEMGDGTQDTQLVEGGNGLMPPCFGDENKGWKREEQQHRTMRELSLTCSGMHDRYWVLGVVVTLVVESMYIHPVRWPVFCPSSLSCIHPHTHVHRLGGGGGGGSMKSQFQCCVLIASSIDYACAVCYAALFLFWERLCVETCFSVSRRYWAAREKKKRPFFVSVGC